MAVRATDTVTLAVAVDVQQVDTWYKLQASTATPPSKPDTADPSGWDTTEPTYDGTATNTLYTCTKTTLTDGTFYWSAVSKSTSYEAAKEAWNKADGAQTAADTALADSVEYIVGTQTAATNLWKGATRDSELKAGKTIAYKLPYAGNSSAATLELTLAGGGSSGAKGVRLNTNNSANVNVTTHFGAGSVVTMTYDGEYWRVTMFNTNDNTYNRMLYSQAVKARAQDSSHTGFVGTHVICGTVDGYVNIAAGAIFDLSYPLLWYATGAGTTIAAGSTANNHYLRYESVKYTVNGTVQGGAAYKMLYLKGTVLDNLFTIAASPFMTTTVPTGEDGYCYIPLGSMTSATNGSFVSSSQLYCYKDGAFGPVSLREASLAAKTATNYITKQGSGDTWVHAEGMGPGSDNEPTSTTRGWRIGDALELFRGTLSMMKAWVDENLVARVRVGLETAGHSVFSPDGMEVFDYDADSEEEVSVAQFGKDGTRIGKSDDVYVSIDSDSFDIVDGRRSVSFTQATFQRQRIQMYPSDASDFLIGKPPTNYNEGDQATGLFFYLEDGNLFHIKNYVSDDYGHFDLDAYEGVFGVHFNGKTGKSSMIFAGRAAYPLFISSTVPTNASSFGMTRCFVYCTADNGLYYCTD